MANTVINAPNPGVFAAGAEIGFAVSSDVSVTLAVVACPSVSSATGVAVAVAVRIAVPVLV